MTDITRDDLRAAVSTGLLSEAQAASLVVVAERRAGVRDRMTGLDEPFELFRGFNEIFIIVGLLILFAGYAGIAGFAIMGGAQGYLGGMMFSGIGLLGVGVCSRYFTMKRRMVGPSNVLAAMFGAFALQFGASLAAMLDQGLPATMATAGVTSVVLLSLYYWRYRVPFTVALIGLAVFTAALALAITQGEIPATAADLFLLSADGYFAFITIGLGIAGLIIAMMFDMSDPHRITRRAQSGFWLHVLAAPAIVNTIALTLFQSEAAGAIIGLVGFIAVMAVFAVVIDRRSFLVSGVGYVVALAITVAEGNAFVVILLLGAGMVLLGAQWEVLRGWLMRRLPLFPGKDRLPPYNAAIAAV